MKHLILPMLLIVGLVGCTSGDVILDEPQTGYVQDVPTARLADIEAGFVCC
jgi:hypothetical protein